MLGYIKQLIKISSFSLPVIWRNIRYNYLCGNVFRNNGAKLYIFPNVIIDLKKDSKINLNGDAFLGLPSIKGSKRVSQLMVSENGCITVKKRLELTAGFDVQIQQGGCLCVDDFHSNVGLEVSCGDSIEIKGKVVAGRYVRVKDFNGHDTDFVEYPKKARILIEDHVWLCTGCSINPGVKISSGVIVADNSNVIQSIPSNTFNQGNPSRVIRENISFNF